MGMGARNSLWAQHAPARRTPFRRTIIMPSTHLYTFRPLSPRPLESSLYVRTRLRMAVAVRRVGATASDMPINTHAPGTRRNPPLDPPAMHALVALALAAIGTAVAAAAPEQIHVAFAGADANGNADRCACVWLVPRCGHAGRGVWGARLALASAFVDCVLVKCGRGADPRHARVGCRFLHGLPPLELPVVLVRIALYTGARVSWLVGRCGSVWGSAVCGSVCQRSLTVPLRV